MLWRLSIIEFWPGLQFSYDRVHAKDGSADVLPKIHPLKRNKRDEEMLIRYSKIGFVAAIALFASLVAFGNMTDYGSNFEFVRHVLLMDTIFPTATIHYRAIQLPILHHAAYVFIIALEALTALLCWAGVYQLLKQVKSPAGDFNRAKNMAVCGLSLGFFVWQVGFMSIGGEWFGMWMSDQWNGVPSAFRFLVTIALVLIYLVQRDSDLDV